MTTNQAPQPQGQAPNSDSRPVVNCDQEAWLKDRVETAVRMAIAVHRELSVRADANQVNGALEGIVNGTVVEIAYTLGLRPEYANLRRISDVLGGHRQQFPMPNER